MRKLLGVVLAGILLVAACAQETPSGDGEPAESLTVYSGRSQDLVGPVIELFERESGIDVDVRYGDTAEMAAAILEEGDNTPADVFWAQDAGALGALAAEDRFATLPDELLERVPAGFRSPEGLWVGVSGRARVLVYNTSNVGPDELPASITELTDESWQGRVGWAPTNGSFQAAVTAMRVVEGEETTRDWLEGMVANDTQVYEGNSPIVAAVASGEIDAGLVNHYYLLEMGAEDPSISENAANHFFTDGDVGSIVNAAGVGIIPDADARERGAPAISASALEFVDFLLSRDAGAYFDEEVFEYPLVADLEPNPALPPLSEIEQPEIDLSDLADLQGTLELLRETQAL